MRAKYLATILALIGLFVNTTDIHGCGNQSPVANLAVIPYARFAGQSITLDGSSSYDPDDEGAGNLINGIWKFEWDFSYDGQNFNCEHSEIANDPDFDGIAENTFTEGEQRVMLRVYDVYNAMDTIERTFYVSNIIYVDVDSYPFHDGTTWQRAFAELQDALDIASSGNEIWVAEGTYKPGTQRGDSFVLIENTAIYGGFRGYQSETEPGETSVEERNLARNKTILSGDIDDNDNGWIPSASNCYHVVTGANNSIVDGFVIAGGVADYTDNLGGGGMLNNGVTAVEVRNCHFLCNNAGDTHHGGAIFNDNTDIELINCLFVGNTAAKFNDGTAVIDYGYGGAVYINYGSTSLINCTLADNMAGLGGGIYIVAGNFNADNSIFWNNQGSGDVSVQDAQIHVAGGTVDVTYSCVNDEEEDGGTVFPGAGNIDKYPKFVIAGGWEGAALPGSLVLEATVRDFRGYWEYTEFDGNGDPIETSKIFPENGHPDFEQYNGEESGIVGYPDQESGVLSLPERKPIYNTAEKWPEWPEGDRYSITTTGPVNFDMWYNDTPGWNMSTKINLLLTRQGSTNIYFFENPYFFPIDGRLFGEDTLYNGKDKSADMTPHHYHFTMELHATFYYDAATTKYYEINGSDDDMYLYINDKLVIDLGGVHSAKFKKLELNGNDAIIYTKNNEGDPWVPEYTISDLFEGADNYDFDLFYAERHQRSANLRFATSLELEPADFSPGDYHLLNDSPCIDVGNNDAVPVDVTLDLDGYPRIFDFPGVPPDGGNAYVDMGVYEQRLNAEPVVDAGTYPPIFLPTSEVYLDNATVTDDDLPNPPKFVSITWEQISGPATVTFDNPEELHTTVRGLGLKGQYTLRLTANDGELDASDEVIITVHPMPWIDAGYPQTIVLPDHEAQLDGEIKDDFTGLITNTVWTLVEWPTGGTVEDFDTSETILDPIVTFTPGIEGDYWLMLTGYDGPDLLNVIAFDLVKITVVDSDVDNEAPVVNAGENQTIILPDNDADMDATATDDGRPYGVLGLEWSVVSCPPGASAEDVIFEPDNTIEDPKVIFPDNITGGYVLQLTASDDDEETDGEVVVIVERDNLCPYDVDAGDYPPIDLVSAYEGANLNLNATYSDDGNPDPPGEVSFRWDVLSGPDGSSVIFSDTSAPYSEISNPTATFDMAGTYVLQVTVDDGQINGECAITDTTIIEVGDPASLTLTVEAGEDKQITQPASVPLDDAEVEIIGGVQENVDTLWSKVSGPGLVDFDEETEVNTTVRFSVPGTYVLKLTGTYGLMIESDLVTITANPGTKLGGGERHSLIVPEDKAVLAFGYNSCGQLGNGLIGGFEEIPGAVQLDTGPPPTYLDQIQAVNAGWRHSLALDTNKSVWAWGDNDEGELGIGTQLIGSPTAVQVKSGAMGSEVTLYLSRTLFADNSYGWDIDAVCILPDNGNIVLSTYYYDAILGDSVNNWTNGLKFDRDDLIEYDPATDTATLFFNGSLLCGDSDTNIDAVHVCINGDIILSTNDNVIINDVTYHRYDLVRIDRDLSDYINGPITATLFFDGASNFVTPNADIDAVYVINETEGQEEIYLSTTGSATLVGEPDVSFDEEDIVYYKLSSPHNTSIYLDGSGIYGNRLVNNTNAIHCNGDNIILSIEGTTQELGWGLNMCTFTDSELVEYNIPDNDAWMYLEESLFGPYESGEDIDAVSIHSDGDVIISTAVQYLSVLGGQEFRKGDLVKYDPDTDTATLFFDGSEVFVDEEDIYAVHVCGNGDVILSALGDVTIKGVTYSLYDLIKVSGDYLSGNVTAELFFNGDWFEPKKNIDAVHVLDNGNIIVSTSDDVTINGQDFDARDLIELEEGNLGDFLLGPGGDASITATRYFNGALVSSYPGSSGQTDAACILDNGHLITSIESFSSYTYVWLGGLKLFRGDLVEYVAGYPYLQDIVSIGAGRSGLFSLAAGSDGSVWAWGRNNYGQIGNDYLGVDQFLPTQVRAGEQGSGTLKNIIEVSGGAEHSMALERLDRANGFYGRVYTWGNNDQGQWTTDYDGGRLGIGTVGNWYSTPVIVHSGEQVLEPPSAYLENIVAVSAGWDHCMALEKLDRENGLYGRVYTWGNNGPGFYTDYSSPGGRLGNGTVGFVNNADTPVTVLSGDQILDPPSTYLENIVAISAGEGHCMALDNEGHVWTWGENDNGQLGNWNFDDSLTAVKVMADLDGDGEPDGYLGDEPYGKIVAISAGYWHCLAMDESGTVWAWGRNYCGQLGIGSRSDKHLPQRVLLGSVFNNTQKLWYPTIQAAIDSADQDDEIIVYPGRYAGNFEFHGVDVTLRSADPDDWNVVDSTIIDGFGSDTVIFTSGNSSTLAGFTITGGTNGVYVHEATAQSPSAPTITNNCIIENTLLGIDCKYLTNPPRESYINITVTNNRIINNQGGGIQCYNVSSCAVKDNFICDNGIYNTGYGIEVLSYINASIIGNTIVNNECEGLMCRDGLAIPDVRHNIIWCNNGGNSHSDNFDAPPSFDNYVWYCCIGGCTLSGNGNIDYDPLFVGGGDYHLQSGSPCINPASTWVPSAGEADIDAEPRLMGTAMDMGADEYAPLLVYAGQDIDRTMLSLPLVLNEATATDNGLSGTPAESEWRYNWSVLSAPGGATVTFADTSDSYSSVIHPEVTLDQSGIYILRFVVYKDENSNSTYEDGTDILLGADTLSITISIGVYAGEDQSLSLPVHTANLSGLAPGAARTEWFYFGPLDPLDVVIEPDPADPENDRKAVVTLPENLMGMYVLWLYAYDGSNEVIASDSLTITVSFNETIVEAGRPKVEQLSSGALELPLDDAWILNNGVINPEYITPHWTLVSGSSSGVTFESGEDYQYNPTITFTESDIYVLKLTAEDGDGAPFGLDTEDTVEVTVLDENGGSNLIVYAGGYYGIGQLSSEGGEFELLLDKAWIYDNGVINPEYITPHWTLVSGSIDGVTFEPGEEYEFNPTITFTESDVYELKLTAEYEGADVGWDTFEVAVFDEDQDLIVYAGSPRTVEIPDASVHLYQAEVIVRSTGMVYIEWEVVSGDAGNVNWITTGDGTLLNPIVEFSDIGTYVLELTATPVGNPDSARSHEVTIYVVPVGFDPDTDNPSIDEFSATQDGSPVPVPVCGQIDIKVRASDVGWGIKNIELRWDDESGVIIKELTGAPSYPEQMQLDYSINTHFLAGDTHTLFVCVTDRSDKFSDDSLQFVSDGPSTSELPIASITNSVFYKDGIYRQPQINPLPILSEGLFELEGSACYPDFHGYVKYKVDLFKSQITALGEPEQVNWNNDDFILHKECFVKNLIPFTGVDVVNGKLGDLDFTGVENGVYQILLTVVNTTTPTLCEYEHVGFVLDCPLKIGNVRFSQEDMVIPVGGMPLRVIRTYDSLHKDQDSDFGYGWSYSIANMDIELDEDRSDYYALEDNWGNYISRSLRFGSNYNRNVTLTLPDGRRATFLFWIDGDGIAQYSSPPGVSAMLVTKDIERMGGYGGWETQVANVTGASNIIVDPANYDFSGYELITADGTTYHIERDDYGYEDCDFYYLDEFMLYTKIYGEPYLSYITTASGEKIDLNVRLSSGRIGDIEYYQKGSDSPTKTIEIDYDSTGHIDKVWAPSEQGGAWATIDYDYDGFGDLIAVHKLVDKTTPGLSWAERYETTTYAYNNHYITDIEDPRGLSPIQYHYVDGRLVGIYDAKENYIALNHDISGRTETVTDRLGNETRHYYNDRGNVVLTLQYEGLSSTGTLKSQTEYFYDSYILEYYDVVGDVLYDNIEQYDNEYTDKPCLVIANDGSKTYYQYNSSGMTTKVIDPELNVTETSYDSVDNPLIITQYKARRNADGSIDTDGGVNPIFDEVTTTENIYGEGDNDKNMLIFTGTRKGSTWYSMSLNYYNGATLLIDTVQINTDFVQDKSSVFNGNQLESISSLPYSGEHVRTTYTYNSVISNSLDKPDSVSEPYPDNGTPIYNHFSHYDDNGDQDYSYYLKDGTYVFNYNYYDAQGRVIKTSRITDVDNNPAGGTEVILSEMIYNSIGKVDHTIDQYDNVTKYEYDQLGNLVETRTYDSGENLLTTTQSLYDTEGRVIVSVGPYDPAVYSQPQSEWPVGTETVYDALGRVVETRKWAGVVINLVPFKVIGGQSVPCDPDDSDMVGKMISPLAEPQNAWDGAGTQPANIGWTMWDVALEQSVVPQIGNELSYSRTEYDVAGRVKHSVTLEEVWEPTAGGGSGAYVIKEQPTTYQYDTAGKQIAVIDPLGHDLTNLYSEDPATGIWKIDFDSFDESTHLNGTHCTETLYDGTRRSSVTDARGNTTEFEYDEALGRLTTTIHPPTDYINEDGDAVTNALLYTHIAYDGLGRKKWETAQVSFVEMPLEGSDNFKENVKQFYYDTAGRLTSVQLPVPEDGADPPIYDYFYDDYGNMVAIWDPLGRLTVFKYNELNQQTHKYQPFEYTGTISTISEIYTAIPTGQDVETREYDDYGRIEKVTDYKNQVTVFFYDNCGLLEYQRHYASDGAYDPLNPTFNATPETNYVYDNLGRKTSVIVTEYNGSGAVITSRQTDYYYDDEGHVQVISSPEGYVRYDYHTVTGHKIETRTYPVGADLNTDVLAGSDNDTTRTSYTYDELGRLEETVVEKRDGATLGTPEVTTYNYNAVGSRDDMALANDVTTDYQYNALNRLTTVSHINSSTTTLGSYTYTLYADGMRAGVAETQMHPDVSTEDHTISYTYDNLNRITDESAVSGSYGYDVDYDYDLVGNRLGREVTITPSNDKFYTKYEYSEDGSTLDDQDRLFREIHSDTDILSVIISPDRPYYAHTIDGGIYYTKAGSDRKIGPLEAWLIGLPSAVSHWLFGLVMALLVVAFFIPAIVQIFCRITKRKAARMPLSLSHRCLSVLIAYVMLISPVGFEQLAQASVKYSQIGTSTWGQTERIIEYGEWDGATPRTGIFTPGYDANGSVTKKTTWDTSGATPAKLEEVTYEYNLQNRLAKVTTDDQSGTVCVAEYTYNDSGIRVSAYSYDMPQGGGAKSNEVTTTYLIDQYNHTGYAQVLEETIDDGSTPILKTYTVGDDVIAQYNSTSGVEHFLYDGHGSTRQLVDSSEAITECFSYDAYGVMLGGNPADTSGSTSLLYAGEQFDTDLQQYYLRARYYDPLNGRFNRTDPFAGSPQDPQSLHKYLYCHANPVNGIDPTGMMSLASSLSSISIKAVLFKATIGSVLGAGIGGAIGAYFHIVQYQTFEGIWTSVGRGAIYGAILGAVLGGLSAISAKLLAIGLATNFGINVVLTAKVLLDPDMRPETKAAAVLLLILSGILSARPIIRGFSTRTVVPPETFSGKGYRVMSKSEYNAARNGKWIESTFTERTGNKWLWTERAAAEEWLKFVVKNGESDSVLTVIKTKQTLNAYETLPHSNPTGTMHSVPISDLSQPQIQ